MNAPLDVALVRQRVEELSVIPSLVSSITYVEQTRSTNDDAAALAKAGAPHGTLVIADHQTQGRGRNGRTWFSEPRSNLLFSVVLRPDAAFEASENIASATLAVGLGVSDAVAAFVDESVVRIKWPNDVLVKSKKVSGVLVEAAWSGARCEYLVLGVGMNVLQQQFASPVDAIATSLVREACVPVSREGVLLELLVCISRRFDQYVRSGLRELMGELAAMDATIGRIVLVGDMNGIAAGIDVSGGLRVAVGGKTSVVRTGEIVFVN